MSIFNASDLRSFTLELSDREIYNDIRAECDISEILELRPDATPEFFDKFMIQGNAYGIGVGETKEIIVTAPSEYINIIWLNITSYSASPVTLFGWGQGACEQLGGEWRKGSYGMPSMCLLPPSLAKVRLRIIERAATSCTVEVENRSDYAIGIVFYISYLALAPGKRYLKLRAVDEISVLKYGRRVMDLVWPMGQHPTKMQSILDAYCIRHSEPVCMATTIIEGTTNEKIFQILTLSVDDKHRFIHPGLEMNEEFFINNTGGSYNREGDGILRGTFDLEQVRDIERSLFFRWDESTWDDGFVWAP